MNLPSSESGSSKAESPKAGGALKAENPKSSASAEKSHSLKTAHSNTAPRLKSDVPKVERKSARKSAGRDQARPKRPKVTTSGMEIYEL